MFWCVWVALAWGQVEPTDQTVIYYNARMALREEHPLESVKLWLLRNAVEDNTGRVSPHDEDFGSVAWAALGDLGVCQDGQRLDSAGAGLWPLGLHNWLVRNRTRKAKAKKPKPFEAFEVGRQSRFVSARDVLSSDELQTVRLFRGGCSRPRIALLSAGESITADFSDRQVSARLLKYLLERSRTTLAVDRVRGMAAIEARLFDVNLQLTALAAREARQKELERARRGRQVGLSSESVAAMADDEPDYTFSDDSEPARILRESVHWSASEWMALSPDRRLFLYDHAKAYGGDPDQMDRIALGVIDLLIAEDDGVEVDRWIAHRGEADRSAIWSGERGRQLLALDRESGFTERSVIALHRGVDLLEQGDLPGSMRAFAYALQLAPDSRAADSVHSLSLRWLTYVAAQFEITDELLVTLQELVPRREYAILLEDLMWGAALRADDPSFERGGRNQGGRGALQRRIELLEPLAKGNATAFSAQIQDGLKSSPSEILRFLDQLIQRLELEDAGVRSAHIPTLLRVRVLLAPLATADGKGRQGRTAATLMDRAQAIVEGLGGLGLDTSRDRARSLGPGGEVFAGSVRLAPSDPLPWPFRASEVAAPSIFEPLDLVPVEWRDPSGEWVFGWSIRG